MKQLKFLIISLILLFQWVSVSEGSTRNPFEPQLPVRIIEDAPPTPQQGKMGLGPSIVPTPEQPTVKTASKKEVKEEVALPDLLVTGLVWGTDRPQAIINGQVVDVGDDVAEIKIVSIEKNIIEVEFQGLTFEIKP